MINRRTLAALLGLFLSALAGCATHQLDEFKSKAAAGDYAWVAAQPVSCDSADDVCGQLHVMRGDACFRLAAQGNDPQAHYRCAADELVLGISQIRTWQSGTVHLDRAQLYANSCEALRQLQDMARGADATQISQRLLEQSQHFLNDEPGNPAAVYYNAGARYALLQGAIVRAQDPQAVCAQLRNIAGQLNAALPAARGTAYENNVVRLLGDVNGAKRAVAGCS